MADLVVLDGNPLERSEAIRDLEVVKTLVGALRFIEGKIIGPTDESSGDS